MDASIASASAMQQQQVQMQVQYSVLKKSLETQKMVGDMIVGLMETANMQTPRQGVSLFSGKNFDATA